MDYLKEMGATADQISRICDVSERTARRWLTGESKPPRPYVRLLELEIGGRAIPESWPQHWKFNSRHLFETESCHKALTWQELTWFSYVLLGWGESMRIIPEIEAAIEYLTGKLPKAEIIQLHEYRERIRELAKHQEMTPEQAVQLARNEGYELPTKESHRAAGC
jgi:hypothetical protein